MTPIDEAIRELEHALQHLAAEVRGHGQEAYAEVVASVRFRVWIDREDDIIDAGSLEWAAQAAVGDALANLGHSTVAEVITYDNVDVVETGGFADPVRCLTCESEYASKREVALIGLMGRCLQCLQGEDFAEAGHDTL